MKKILSIALALALCLTAMMGCFVVSAAANTLAVGTANITVGDATADVVVDITSEGVWAIRFDVKSDVALTAVAIDDANFNAELEGTKVLVQSVANDYANNITAAKITLTFATADLAADEYAVAIENIDAGNYAEAAVAFDTTAGAIVVAEAVVEPAEPELVNFTIRNPALMVKEKYGFRIRIDKGTDCFKDANNAVFNYDHYEVVLETQEYVGSNYTLTDVVKTFTEADIDVSSTSARDYYFYKNVTAYALNVPISLTVKFYDAENNYVAYSNTLTFSISELTKAKLADASTNANLKTVYMDMLNYGAAAQVYFSKFGTNNPLKTAESITKDCEAYQQYASQTVPTLTGTNVPADISGDGFVITPGLQASSSNNIYYRFTVPTTLNASDLKVVLNHTDLYGNKIENTYAIGDLGLDNKGRYVLAYDAVAIFDSAAVVSAVVKTNADVEICSLDYNIDFYVNSKMGDATYKDVFGALSKFSVSSMNYFKSLIG